MATTTASATAALMPLVDALVSQQLTDLPAPVLQELIVAVTPLAGRLHGFVQACAGQLEAACAGQLATDDGRTRTVAGWLAEVQSSTASTAGRQLRTSRALRQLPLVADAVLDGVLTPEQAAVLSRLVGPIELSGLLAAQADLVLVAAAMDPVELGRWVAHQIATHCEPALDAQAGRARDRRWWQSHVEADGTVRGRFVLAAEDAETVLTVLEPLARKAGNDDRRTAGQRRADALVELAEQVLRHGQLPDAGGLRPQLSYVLPADWAAGQQAQAACPDCGPRCDEHRLPGFADTVAADLPGGPAGAPTAGHACAVAAWTGPQTRARIETMLCDARISRVLLDPVGQVQGLQPLRDSVTPRQRRELAARDLGCAVRGCTRPPAMCDAHHLRSRADGGPTDIGNLVLLCRRHHVLWHLGKIGLHHLDVRWHPDRDNAAATSGTAPPTGTRP